MQEDVFRLDITVHDAMLVRVGERGRDLGGKPHGSVHRQRRSVVEPLSQGFPLDVRHHEKEEAFGLPGIVELQDMGMAQFGDDLDFAQEPVGAESGGHIRAQHLDGDEPIVL